MFKALINSLLEILGITVRSLRDRYVESDPKEFMRGIGRGAIVLRSVVERTLTARAIRGASDSVFEHAFVYFGKSGGRQGRLHEIVEAVEAGVVVNPIDKYVNAQYQLVAFTPEHLTDDEFRRVREQTYAFLGSAYDYQEIFSHVFGFVPNPPERVTCSSLCAAAYHGVRRLVKKNVDSRGATPGDLWDGLYPQVRGWRMTRHNIR